MKAFKLTFTNNVKTDKLSRKECYEDNVKLALNVYFSRHCNSSVVKIVGLNS